jgi:hypothetical protein
MVSYKVRISIERRTTGAAPWDIRAGTMAGAAPLVMCHASSVAANIHQVRICPTGARSVFLQSRKVRSIGVLLTELETYMHRTFLAVTIAAVAGFATAVHAHDGAAPRSTVVLPHAGQPRGHVTDLLRPPHGQMIVAELRGEGKYGEPCHASNGSNFLNRGTYDYEDRELICKDSSMKIWCHPDDHSPITICWDGWKE